MVGGDARESALRNGDGRLRSSMKGWIKREKNELSRVQSQDRDVNVGTKAREHFQRTVAPLTPAVDFSSSSLQARQRGVSTRRLCGAVATAPMVSCDHAFEL